jgi:hypothetical protein
MTLMAISEPWHTPRVRSTMLGPLRWRPVTRRFGPTRSPCLVLLGIPRGSVVERHAFQLQAKDRPKRKLRRCRVVDHMGQPLRPPRENMENGNPVHELSRDTEPGLQAGGAGPSVSATVTDDHRFPGLGHAVSVWGHSVPPVNGLWFSQAMSRPERLLRLGFQRPDDLKSSSDSLDHN